MSPMSWNCGSHETTTVSSPAASSAMISDRFAPRHACVTMTPLGALVEPDVYCRNDTDSLGLARPPASRRAASATTSHRSSFGHPSSPLTHAANSLVFFAQLYRCDVSASRAPHPAWIRTNDSSSRFDFFRGSGGYTGTAITSAAPHPRNAPMNVSPGSNTSNTRSPRATPASAT